MLEKEMIEACFFPFEAAQILALPLPEFQKDDSFCWQGTQNGEYKAKSAYHMIKCYGNEAAETSARSLGKGDKV